MRHLKNLFITFAVILTTNLASQALAVSARTLKDTNDTAHKTTQIDGSLSILNGISAINNYIWFFIGFFCFVFMIINGYKLITANGDEKAIKSARTALLGSVIGIVVCLLAYIIVNLAVRILA